MRRPLAGARALRRVAFVAAVLALAACDRGAEREHTASAPQPPAAEAYETARMQSLNDYVEALNVLVGASGLAATRDSYLGLDIPHAHPSFDLSFYPGSLDEAALKLKAGRELSLRHPEPLEPSVAVLDERAGALIAALDELAPRLLALEPYYRAKSYREDGLARGRAAHPALAAGFQAADAAAVGFHAALQVRLAAREQTRLARLKERGDVLGYHTVLAMVQAKQLMRDAKAAGSMAKDSRAFDIADASARALEQTLFAARAEVDTEKARRPAGAPRLLDDRAADTQGLVDELTAFVGRYRDLKAKRTEYEARYLVQHYNQAVDRANRMRGAG